MGEQEVDDALLVPLEVRAARGIEDNSIAHGHAEGRPVNDAPRQVRGLETDSDVELHAADRRELGVRGFIDPESGAHGGQIVEGEVPRSAFGPKLALGAPVDGDPSPPEQAAIEKTPEFGGQLAVEAAQVGEFEPNDESLLVQLAVRDTGAHLNRLRDPWAAKLHLDMVPDAEPRDAPEESHASPGRGGVEDNSIQMGPIPDPNLGLEPRTLGVGNPPMPPSLGAPTPE